MNSKVITVVLIIAFSCFAFAADKPSKRVNLRPGNNNVSQSGNSEIIPLPDFASPFGGPDQLYKAPSNLQWINHTDSGMEYYLGSGAEADTMAVWYKGAGACSLYSIQTQWFDGDDASTVLFYVWEVSDNAQVGDPGLTASRDDWEGGTPLGDIVAGPIPFAPGSSQDWLEILLEDYGDVPFFGDTEGNPEAFFVGWVKGGEVPHILADDVGGRGYNYSWFGGPWTEGAWGWYNLVIEYGVQVGVTYPYGAKPSIGGIAILPETYDGNHDVDVTATVTDEGTVTGAWLYWNINDPNPGTDSVAMTAEEDLYTGTFNPGAAVGDTVYYWVSATDNAGNRSMENLLSPNSFHIIAPVNPGAEILLVLENTFVDPEDYPGFTWQFILDSMGYSYEVWDVAEMNGIDRFTTNAGWTDGIVVISWGTSVIPTRTYEATDAFATFLDNGGMLFYTDQDYFFGNGEVEEPTFVSGDFAFDYLSLSGGSNDVGVDVDTMVIGAEGDDITDFMSADFLPMRPNDWGGDGSNWTDYLIADQAEFIVTSETGEDVGVKYDAGTFRTVYYAYAIEAMNSVEGWSDTTNGAWDSNFWTMVENSFDWLGFVASGTAIDGNTGIAPQRFSLEQNYPNPFNPSTEITFRLGKAVDVDLAIYSVTGQKVRTLVKGNQKAGKHAVTWNGMNDLGQRVATGVYFYSLNAGDFKAMKKMVLIK